VVLISHKFKIRERTRALTEHISALIFSRAIGPSHRRSELGEKRMLSLFSNGRIVVLNSTDAACVHSIVDRSQNKLVV
jgi:hypothetical protein